MLSKKTIFGVLICLSFSAFSTVVPPSINPKNINYNQRSYSHSQYFKDEVMQHWYDKINIAGQVNVAGFASNKTPTTVGLLPPTIAASPAASDIVIPFAALSFDSHLTNWTEVMLAFAYSQRSPSVIRSPAGGGEVFFVDSAYILIANADFTPWYLKAGRYFIDFGGMDFSSINESTVQLLSLIRATQIQFGFHNWHGFNASVYLFEPNLNYYTEINTSRTNAIGVDLSYKHKTENFEFIVDAGYLSNMVGSLYASSTVANNSRFILKLYSQTVPGLDLNAFIKIQPFDFSINYIAALSAFSVFDVPFTKDGGESFIGAKPTALGINLGYSFSAFCHETRLGGGYQSSTEAAALGLATGSLPEATAGVYGYFFAIGMPKERIYLNYVIKQVCGVDIGMEVDAEKGYGYLNGGTGKKDLVGILMLSAKFG